MSFNNFPYMNFHELNLDYFNEHFKKIFAEWDELNNSLLTWKEQTDKENAAWKTDTETDIEQWKQEVLQNLDTWKGEFQRLFDSTFTNLEQIKTDAEAARDSAKEYSDEIKDMAENFPKIDSTLSIAGDAADAKAVGDVIYGNRNRNDLTIYPLLSYFKGINTISRIEDMPINTWTSAQGSVLAPLLTAFPYTLANSVTYKATRIPLTTAHTEIWIYNTGFTECYRGRTNNTSPNTFLWTRVVPDMEIDSTLSIAGDAADAKAVGDIIYGNRNRNDLTTYPILSYFKGINTISRIEDMPVNTWTSAQGSVLTPLLTAFTYTLTNSVTYKVTRIPLTTAHTEIWIYNTGFTECYRGRTNNTSPNTFLWTRVVPDMFVSELKTEKLNFVYTEFESLSGMWNNDGTLADTGYHSNLIKINENSTYYMNNNDNNVIAAFFDENGVFLSTINKGSKFKAIDYQKPDPTGRYTQYVNIYEVVSPAGAMYVSLNLSENETYRYRQYIATKPVFAYRDTGNYVFNDSFPAYQAHKNNNLCMITASSGMIDRLFRDAINQYVVGYQEYLIPWYKSVTTYGYSGAAWADIERDTPSIYSRVVTDKLQLSGYDEFILGYSTNGLTAESLGEWDSTDKNTLFGGMNGVIDYIYSQNPTAKIYALSCFNLFSPSAAQTVKDLRDNLYDGLLKLCQRRGIQMIDLRQCSGINQNTYTSLTYDNTHPNQYGMKIIGEYIRKEIVGV